MIKMKKRLCLLLVVVLLAGLLMTGCSTAETQLIKCAKAMSKTSGFKMETEVNMQLGFAITGIMEEEQSLDIALVGSGDVTYSPFELSLTLSPESEMLPLDDMMIEIKQIENGMLVRTSMDGGKTWTESEKETDISQSSFKMDAKTLLGIVKNAKNLEELGKKEIRGSEATGYGYTFTGEMIADNMKEGIAISGTDITIEPELFRGTDGAKLAFWIDNKSNLIARAELDLSDMFSTVMQEFMKTYLTQILEEQMGDQMALFTAMGIDLGEMIQVSVPAFTVAVDAVEYRSK